MTTRTRINRRLAVKIAQDVLVQLNLNRYKATSGTYCDVKSNGRLVDVYVPPENIEIEASFKTLFEHDKQVTCDVCAMGSLFTSFVNIENQFTVREVAEPDFDQMLEKLGGAFTTREILLMEYVFERGQKGFLVINSKRENSYRYVVDVTDDYGNDLARVAFTMGELRRAIAYSDRYEDSDSRLRTIMKNIIRNKGTFKLPLRVR